MYDYPLQTTYLRHEELQVSLHISFTPHIAQRWIACLYLTHIQFLNNVSFLQKTWNIPVISSQLRQVSQVLGHIEETVGRLHLASVSLLATKYSLL